MTRSITPPLEAENQRLQGLLEKMENKIESQSKEIHSLNEHLAILLSKRYRTQSEQLKHIQGPLFDEAELEQAIADTFQAIEAHNTAAAETSSPEMQKTSKAPASKPK